ncbi:MAG: hypothetical protein PHD97_01825 [Bacteroidales bacterium]|nr:hypothetical protein [Bacteroidales bacterium]
MRNISKLFLAIFVLTCIFYSCGKSKQGTKFSSDMEQEKYWMNLPTIIKGNANSGKYACKMDSTKEFSFGFCSKIEEFTTRIPKKVKVNFFSYSKNSCEGTGLVIQIDSVGKNIFWTSGNIAQKLGKINTWNEIDELFSLPAKLLPSYEIKIYIWNPKKKEFYIDDFSVEFLF